VSEMFTNYMPPLQVGGNLRPVIMMCAARLIGAYNDLFRDLGLDHLVVKLIMEAARRAGVDDVRVKDGSCHRYHAVVKDWSRPITAEFTKVNDQVSRDNPKVNEELLRVLIDRVEKLKALAAAHVRITLYQVNIQSQGLMLNAAQQSSPRSPVHHHQTLHTPVVMPSLKNNHHPSKILRTSLRVLLRRRMLPAPRLILPNWMAFKRRRRRRLGV
jgi:hypothetical protein